jgi:hypothetical protein
MAEPLSKVRKGGSEGEEGPHAGCGRRYLAALLVLEPLLSDFDEEPFEEDLESDFELDESEDELVSLLVSDLDSDDSDLELDFDLDREPLSFL